MRNVELEKRKGERINFSTPCSTRKFTKVFANKRRKQEDSVITLTHPFLESILLVKDPQQVGKMKKPQKSCLSMEGLKATS